MCTRACAHTLNDLRTHAREELELLATEEKTLGCSARENIPDDVDLNVAFSAAEVRVLDVEMWYATQGNEGLDVGNR